MKRFMWALLLVACATAANASVPPPPPMTASITPSIYFSDKSLECLQPITLPCKESNYITLDHADKLNKWVTILSRKDFYRAGALAGLVQKYCTNSESLFGLKDEEVCKRAEEIATTMLKVATEAEEKESE